MPLLKNVSSIRTLVAIDLTLSYDKAQLRVVRFTLMQQEQVNDRRRTAIFQICTKFGNKGCKVIVAIASISLHQNKTITILGMKPVKYPNPYKVTWIDATSIDVQGRCHIFIQFGEIQIICDVTHSMDVDHIILWRPWLFDLDVIIYRRTNHCSVVHNGKRMKLMPSQPKPPTSEKKIDKGKEKMGMNLISSDQLEQSLNKGLTCYALVARKTEAEIQVANSRTY